MDNTKPDIFYGPKLHETAQVRTDWNTQGILPDLTILNPLW
jgi:hypothetical protein